MLGCVAALLALLAGCGLGSNAPPTDDEALSAFMVYWNEHAPKDGTYSLLTPVSVHQLDNAVTSDSSFGRERTVSATYTFRATARISYECGGFSDVIEASTDERRHPHVANAGDLIPCTLNTHFTKIEEGWLMHFLGWDTEGYIIKR